MNRQISNIYYASQRAQEIVLVLASLDDLGGVQTKQDTLDYIFSKGWIQTFPGETVPYWSCNEPRVRTLLAWARKDALMRDFLFHHGRDQWELTRKGREGIEKFREHCQSKNWDVRKCYRWSPVFKKLMDPDYAPSAADAKPPVCQREELLTLVF